MDKTATTTPPEAVVSTMATAQSLVEQAKAMAAAVANGNHHKISPRDVWSVLHRTLLTPRTDFAIHQQCYELVYNHNRSSSSIKNNGCETNTDDATTAITTMIHPTWMPTDVTRTQMHQLMQRRGFETYPELYDWSIANHETEDNSNGKGSTNADYWMTAQSELNIRWETPPDRSFAYGHGDAPAAHATYYPNGRLNITDSVLPHHGDGGDDDLNQPAVIFGTADTLVTWSTSDLTRYTNKVAHALVQILRVSPGTAVALCLPLTPESLAVYLGIVRAGCVVVSIADSFSAAEIATRCAVTRASVLFTQDVIWRSPTHTLPLYDRVVQAIAIMAADEATTTTPTNTKTIDSSHGGAPGSMRVVVLPSALHHPSSSHPSTSSAEILELHESISLRPEDMSWKDFLRGASDEFDAVIVDSMDPCNYLFSSGTTGTPKAIVWSHVTPIKCAADGRYHLDITSHDRVAWPTNMGWMMGPWLLFQRLNRATICLYTGGPPHTTDFCRFVERSGVTMLGVIPSLVQAWRTRGSCDLADWSNVTRFASTGEASDPVLSHWVSSRVPGYAPVLEYCGGTEIGGSFLSSTMLHANVPSLFATPVLGSQVRLLDAETNIVSSESAFAALDTLGCVTGELVLVPPSVGWSTRLLNRNHYECYYEGMPKLAVDQDDNSVVLRRHGDCVMAIRDEPNTTPYYAALGRCDDTMNLGGIKVSSVELEQVCNTVGCVRETAAIAVRRGTNGNGKSTSTIAGPSQLVVYAVCHEDYGEISPDLLKREFQKAIKVGLNPLFAVSDVIVMAALPRTASNKVLRRQLRDKYAQQIC